MASTIKLESRHSLSRSGSDPGLVTSRLLPYVRPDLPIWAVAHWAALLTWDLAGLTPEEQIQFLRAQGLSAGRALRLAMAVPPLTPQGHRERVRRAAQLLNDDPGRFWQVVESLQVYWGIHPWSILGEPLPPSLEPAWLRDLGGPSPSRKGLRFCGVFGSWTHLPASLCASRIQLEHLPLPRLPRGWIVEELTLRKCPKLQGSLADITVLQAVTVTDCPRFDPTPLGLGKLKPQAEPPDD